MVPSRKSAREIVWAVNWSGCLKFHGTLFWLERMTGRKTKVIQIRVFGRHFLKNEKKWTCHFRGNNWQYLFMIKIWAFKWKLEFWETSIYHHELDSLIILNDFCHEIGGDIKKCIFFLSCIIKCVNIWKMCVTWGTNIFQMTNADNIHSCMGPRST